MSLELLRTLAEGAKDATTVVAFLGGSIGYMRVLTGAVDTPFLWKKKPTLEGMEEVDHLRRKLIEMKTPLREPVFLSVTGMFYPGLLLASGWWERQGADGRKSEAPRLVWRDGLQEWLFCGFEQWAPSWDLSASTAGKTEPYLLGQLGAGDEANSLPVIVAGKNAERIRHDDDFLGRQERIVFEAKATGLLYHRDHLPERYSSIAARWGTAFDYCLLIDENDPRHDLIPQGPGLHRACAYSGYLWQCWGPSECLKTNETPRLDEVYFLWEHTDFTKPDAVAYNLDSLQNKAVYLRKRNENLVLLQKSSPAVPGDPKYATKMFYDYILNER